MIDLYYGIENGSVIVYVFQDGKLAIKFALSGQHLDAHIGEMSRLRGIIQNTGRSSSYKPYIDSQTGVNLDAPPTSSAPSRHREAGPDRGGPGAGHGSGSAWQGYGSGPGSGGGGGGHGAL